jgi:hypothetical protein
MILIPDLVPFRHWVSRGVFLVVPDFCVCGVVWCGVVWCGVVWYGVVWLTLTGWVIREE